MPPPPTPAAGDTVAGFADSGLTTIPSRDGVVRWRLLGPGPDNAGARLAGNGMVERTGMGAEKLDVTAYTWQALGTLAEMAASRGDAATESWATAQADAIEQRFDSRWWLDTEGLFADSMGSADGRAGLDAYIAAAQRFMPGARLERVGPSTCRCLRSS